MTDDAVGTLTREVSEAAGRLAGSAEAAATLESIGAGDERARRLNRANVFRLAAEVALLQDGDDAAEARRAVEAERRRVRIEAKESAGRRPGRRGAALALPLAIAVGCIPLLSGQLWTTGRTGVERATAIALAVAASFCAVAGFVLAAAVGAAGRRRHPRAARRAALRLTGLGVVAAMLTGLGLWAVLSWKDFVAPGEAGITLQCFALLTALWLAAGLTLAAGRAWWVTLSFAAGTVVGLVVRVTGLASPTPAHRAGILTSIALCLLVAWRATRRDRRRAAGRRARGDAPMGPPPLAARPRVPVLVLFGTAVGGLLFADRVASWYAPDPFHLWILSLRPATEAGWVWALVAMIGGMVVAAAAALRFGPSLDAAAERLPLTARRALAGELRASYRRWVIRLLFAAAAGAAVSFVGVLILVATSSSFAEAVTRDTALTFVVAGPGLALLAWAAYNAAILFGLGRPRAPLAGVWAGLAVDVAVALLLAARARSWTTAFGLLAGAAVCWLVTTVAARRALRDADVALATR
jgi:hypothetical protein